MTRESGNQSTIRDHYSAQGWRLGRNNVGVLTDRRGVPVRFGLFNDSPQVNAQIKTGDLIGYAPRLVTPEMVGEVIAQFASIECKPDGWRFRESDARAVAQRRWARMVQADGGIAGFMIRPDRGFEPC